MALDKLVDSTQLDSDLTSVANAIRAKSGGSSQLAFPAGFVSEIQAIPSGGGGDYVAADFADYTKPEGDVIFLQQYLGNQDNRETPNYFACRTKVTKIYAPNFRFIADNQGAGYFRNLTGMKYLIFPSNTRFYNNCVYNCSSLLAIDCAFLRLPGSAFGIANNDKMATIVVRESGSPFLNNINAFNGTPFASGKAGGTLYVPQFMIAEYQAATNWSTILGYPNNSIVALEGSPYESKYVDGVTDVPTKAITQNLTNCSSSYSKATMYWNTGYEITFTPDAGYTMSSVTITSGGTDISSSYDSTTGKATFNCTGDIVITATAS